MITKVDWEEFRDNGLLWFINSILHVFGYSIVFQYDGDKLENVYPARVKFRGFSEKNNFNGYIALSKYMIQHGEELLKEAEE